MAGRLLTTANDVPRKGVRLVRLFPDVVWVKQAAIGLVCQNCESCSVTDRGGCGNGLRRPTYVSERSMQPSVGRRGGSIRWEHLRVRNELFSQSIGLPFHRPLDPHYWLNL